MQIISLTRSSTRSSTWSLTKGQSLLAYCPQPLPLAGPTSSCPSPQQGRLAGLHLLQILYECIYLCPQEGMIINFYLYALVNQKWNIH